MWTDGRQRSDPYGRQRDAVLTRRGPRSNRTQVEVFARPLLCADHPDVHGALKSACGLS